MKTKLILLSIIMGLPIISFAQFSVITTYDRADTALQVKFINKYSTKQVIIRNELQNNDGGSYCEVTYIGHEGGTLSSYRLNYVNENTPTLRYILLKPTQEESFVFKLKDMNHTIDLKLVSKIIVHVWVKRTIKGTKYASEINYQKEFLLN